jgi:glyoxylase-like metal-dependent hydrolase (beta-lactamase superfamily II)
MVAGSANGIYAAASSWNRSLRRILLTHVHDDHIGSLDVLSNKLIGV